MMSKFFKKLPGYSPSPPGLERLILRKSWRWTLFGTAAIFCSSLLIRILIQFPQYELTLYSVRIIDFLVLSTAIFFWTMMFTVILGAFIVALMKGPAYVADAYPLSDADRPKR